MHKEQSGVHLCGTYLSSWNVRSLVDVEGAVETARQGAETKQAEDWRIDLVVRELDWYCVSVAGLQETRWFGNEIYEVGESVVLTAGRPSPKPRQQIQRGEDVAIVLSGPAKTAWKAGGQQLSSWGSRLIKAMVKNGKTTEDQLHVLSCYAPTFAASRGPVPGQLTGSH